jgi:hypothetical protein
LSSTVEIHGKSSKHGKISIFYTISAKNHHKTRKYRYGIDYAFNSGTSMYPYSDFESTKKT